MLLEFVGILIFSAISGNISNVKKEPDLKGYIQKRVASVEEFIFLIDRMSHKALDDEIYDIAASYIEQSYRFGVAKSFKGNIHYQRMSARLKNQLVMVVLKQYYDKMFFFFHDVHENNSCG